MGKKSQKKDWINECTYNYVKYGIIEQDAVKFANEEALIQEVEHGSVVDIWEPADALVLKSMSEISEKESLLINLTYVKGQLFQHIDGGFYQFEKSVLFADDNDELIVYDHIWPFPVMSSARRAVEFSEKFTPVTEYALNLAKKESAQNFQKLIIANKEKRKAS